MLHKQIKPAISDVNIEIKIRYEIITFVYIQNFPMVSVSILILISHQNLQALYLIKNN